MAKISVKRKATIELSEGDWKKIEEVYGIINYISEKLTDIGLELDDSEVEFKDSDDNVLDIGEHLQSVYNAIDTLLCEKSGLY